MQVYAKHFNFHIDGTFSFSSRFFSLFLLESSLFRVKISLRRWDWMSQKTGKYPHLAGAFNREATRNLRKPDKAAIPT